MNQPAIVVLHGALGSAHQLAEVSEAFKQLAPTYSLNFSGHGGQPFKNVFTIEQFSAELSDFLTSNNLSEVNIFGYSMGGYVALKLASMDTRIKKIFTLGTKYNWTVESAIHETKMLDSTKIEEKVPKFAQALNERHAPNDWKLVLEKTKAMMLSLGQNPTLSQDILASINIPVAIGIGTDDNMVSIEESLALAKALGNAQLVVFEGGKHPIEQVSIPNLYQQFETFFKK